MAQIVIEVGDFKKTVAANVPMLKVKETIGQELHKWAAEAPERSFRRSHSLANAQYLSEKGEQIGVMYVVYDAPNSDEE